MEIRVQVYRSREEVIYIQSINVVFLLLFFVSPTFSADVQ